MIKEKFLYLILFLSLLLSAMIPAILAVLLGPVLLVSILVIAPAGLGIAAWCVDNLISMED